ncbi:MAG: ADP-ribosylglycohydrolase family protein [Bacteroidales bacterium]|nr:ADP-ribosylglycohydrolase family protein [Bacteroidales bacterium]
MKRKYFFLLLMISGLLFASCSKPAGEFKTISSDQLRDKILGGWAGKMIGVTYGAPTEFHALNKTFDDSIKWKPSDSWQSMWQDDIYVQLTFLETMDQYGIDAPAKLFQEKFARAGYQLWHANMQTRKNYYDSIFPPESGSPEYSMHSDDIDFQIEADYIGFMCPGMPQTIAEISEKIGHIMNYGDGVYGGIFVGALYAEAYFESDIMKVIQKALLSLPAKCDYYKIVKDVILLHEHYPADWRSAWKELNDKWGQEDICGVGSDFNIDAKLNGAFIVMGLLYGNGDPLTTLEITARCGQDSDCNPSNAMALLGVIKGFSALPKDMQDGVMSASDSTFVFTSYNLNSAVASTYKYATELIVKNGGKAEGDEITVKIQEPQAPALEVSYPDLVLDKVITVFDKGGFSFKGDWNPIEKLMWPENVFGKQALFSGKAGDEMELEFEGTGISLEGNWVKDGGKADVYVDGVLNRSIDTYYFYAQQEHITSIWHVLNLEPGIHHLRLVVKGEKRPESEGSNVYLAKAYIFKTAPKKSAGYKFSFQES